MKKSINIGACYRDSTVFWSQWRVDRIFTNFLGLPHAVVVSLSDPTVRRTIACQTLSDKRRYHRVGSDEARQAVTAIAGNPAVPGDHISQDLDRLGVAA